MAADIIIDATIEIRATASDAAAVRSTASDEAPIRTTASEGADI